MPPKKIKDTGPGITLSDAQASIIASFLRHLEAPHPDWKAIMAEVGGSKVGNVQKSFRSAIAPFNLSLTDGKIVDASDAPIATPKIKANGTDKKRKASEESGNNGDDSGADETPVKKTAKTEQAKEEVADGSD